MGTHHLRTLHALALLPPGHPPAFDAPRRRRLRRGAACGILRSRKAIRGPSGGAGVHPGRGTLVECPRRGVTRVRHPRPPGAVALPGVRDTIAGRGPHAAPSLSTAPAARRLGIRPVGATPPGPSWFDSRVHRVGGGRGGRPKRTPSTPRLPSLRRGPDAAMGAGDRPGRVSVSPQCSNPGDRVRDMHPVPPPTAPASPPPPGKRHAPGAPPNLERRAAAPPGRR